MFVDGAQMQNGHYAVNWPMQCVSSLSKYAARWGPNINVQVQKSEHAAVLTPHSKCASNLIPHSEFSHTVNWVHTVNCSKWWLGLVISVLEQKSHHAANFTPCSKFYPMQQIGPCSKLVHAADLHHWRWGLVPIHFMGQFAVWVNLLCIHYVLTFLHLYIDVDSQPPLVPICYIVSSLHESFHCVVTFLFLNIDLFAVVLLSSSSSFVDSSHDDRR